VKGGDTFTCVECGRTGSRDFIGLSGDWATDSPNFEVICASRRACQRRQELRAKAGEPRSQDPPPCTCDVRPPTRSATVARGISGYAVYLDSIKDETVFDPACPFHGDDGSMVAEVKSA
jgi:hypothetical protein